MAKKIAKKASKKRGIKTQTKRKTASRRGKKRTAKSAASTGGKKRTRRAKETVTTKRRVRLPRDAGGAKFRTTLSFPTGLMHEVEEGVIHKVRGETGYLITRAAVFNAGVKIVVENYEKMDMRRVYNLFTFTEELRRALKK